MKKFIADEDDEKCKLNKKLVEEEHQHPEEVWARRYREITKLTWKRWLEGMYGILKDVMMGEDFESDAAKKAIKDTNNILLNLGDD